MLAEMTTITMTSDDNHGESDDNAGDSDAYDDPSLSLSHAHVHFCS